MGARRSGVGERALVAHDLGPPAVGRNLHEWELVDAAGRPVPEAVGMVGGGTAQHVNADAVAGAGAAHPVPALVRWQEGGDVPLRPPVAADLLDLRPLAV